MLKTSAFRFLKSPATDETPIRKKPPRCSWWFCPLATARKRSSWRRPNKAEQVQKWREKLEIYGHIWKIMNIYMRYHRTKKKSGKHNCLISIFSGVLYHTISRHLYMVKQFAELTRGTNQLDPKLPDFTSWGLSVTSWFLKIKPIDYSCIPLINPTSSP